MIFYYFVFLGRGIQLYFYPAFLAQASDSLALSKSDLKTGVFFLSYG
jgi:hypothetical protein